LNVRRALTSLLPAVMVPLAGCATLSALRQEPLATGVQRTFPTPLEPTVAAARQAVTKVGVAIRSDTALAPHAWMLLGEKGTSGWSWSALVRVVAQRAESSRTVVNVVTRRRLAGNIGVRPDLSVAIFDSMETSLGPATVPAGTRVRLTWREGNATLLGELLDRRGDTLVVYNPALRSQITPTVRELRALEVSRGRRSAAWPGEIAGSVIGMVIGGVIGARNPTGGWVIISREVTSLRSFVLGGFAGALAGSLVGSAVVSDRWRRVPPDRLTIQP